MENLRFFSFLSDSLLKLTQERKDRNKKWTLSVFNTGDPEYDFDLIKFKYNKILSSHYNSPTFDNSPESTWNYLSERELRDSKDYTNDFFLFKKIKSVPQCFEVLKRFEDLKTKYRKIILSEMKEFVVEMVDRGMDSLDVLFLCSLDISWARLYHIFSHNYVQMYSPRAHFISLKVQQVELFNLYIEKYRIELLEAMYCKYNPARELFEKTIIQKRQLISQDSFFYKRLKKELPQLPISMRIQSKYIEDVIDSIRRVTPTEEATKLEKEFMEEIYRAMDEPIRKQMDESITVQEELKKMQKDFLKRKKEYWEKIDKEEDLRWQKLLQEEIQKMMDKPLVLEEKEELDQPDKELDQPEEELDQPDKELDQPEEELDQPDKELDLDQQIKEQKNKPAKPLKQKKKNSKKDKNA